VSCVNSTSTRMEGASAPLTIDALRKKGLPNISTRRIVTKLRKPRPRN
jgi:hypothetical protein